MLLFPECYPNVVSPYKLLAQHFSPNANFRYDPISRKVMQFKKKNEEKKEIVDHSRLNAYFQKNAENDAI